MGGFKLEYFKFATYLIVPLGLVQLANTDFFDDYVESKKFIEYPAEDVRYRNYKKVSAFKQQKEAEPSGGKAE